MADNETAFVCEAANRTFNIETPNSFGNTRAIERSHNLSPRFGHTSEINNLINGSSEDAKDYTVGLLASAIAIFCFFLLWLVTLIGLKCLGYKRVGFFSGHQVKVRKPKPTPYEGSTEQNAEQEDDDADEPENVHKDLEEDAADEEQGEDEPGDVPMADPKNEAVEEAQDADQSDEDTGGAVETAVETEDAGVRVEPDAEEDMEEKEQALKETAEEGLLLEKHQDLQKEYEEEVAKVERRLRRIRIVVLICGLGITVCVILMCLLGIENIVDSLDNGREGLNKAEDIAQGGIDLIDAYVERQEAAAEAVSGLRLDVNGFCPGLREDICSNVTSGTSVTCDLSDLPNGDELFNFLNDTTTFLYGELGDLRHDLEEIVEIFQDADDASEEFYWAFYIALAFAIPLGVLNLMICFIVVMAWNKKLSQGSYCYRKIKGCLLKGCVVPLFIFLVLMSLIFSLVFVIGSTAAADTCIDSPDGRLARFLIDREDKFDSVVFEFAVWILEGCRESLVPLELENQAQNILSFFKVLVDLTTAFANENPAEFQAICGTDPTVVDAVARALAAQICVLSTTMFDIQDFFSCQNWHPLYEVIMYDAVCEEGTEGLSWLAITQFIIVFLSMIMLTLRVAFSESLSEEEEAELEESRRAFWAGVRRRLTIIFCCRCGKKAEDVSVQESNSEELVQNQEEEVSKSEELVQNDNESE